MVADPAPLAFVCAMPMELAPITRRLRLTRGTVGDLPARTGRLDGRPVVGIVTGMGTRLATDGVTQLLDEVTPAAVLVVGITGAVDDDTAIGTLIVPERVIDHATGRQHQHRVLGPGTPSGALWTTDVITTADVLPDLRAQGVVSLDMETAAIALVCEERGVPWHVFRAISDRATDGTVDDEVFRLSKPSGRPDPAAILRYVARHPARVPRLARMGRDARLATQQAADAALAAARTLA